MVASGEFLVAAGTGYTALADHAERPRSLGPLRRFDGRARRTGPCGDTIEVWVRTRGERVIRAAFTTTGCGASRACGSMATVLAAGATLAAAARLRAVDVIERLGPMPVEETHCAQLAVDTLHAACADAVASRRTATAAPPEGLPECAACETASCEARNARAGEDGAAFEQRQKLARRICRIDRSVIVLSGKGGVGKSTVAVNLAAALARRGDRVGLLDADIHGPSVPRMLGVEGAAIGKAPDGMAPVSVAGLKVMSVGFLLAERGAAVIWRGPRKMGAIRQLLADTDWGALDWLIIDAPPGTGDEPLSLCQLLGDADGALVVTTPQDVAVDAVRRSLAFCVRLELPVLGVVENMSGFLCPHCGALTELPSSGGGERLAAEAGVPFLGRVPLVPGISRSGDAGVPFVSAHPESAMAARLLDVLRPVIELAGPAERGAAARHL